MFSIKNDLDYEDGDKNFIDTGIRVGSIKKCIHDFLLKGNLILNNDL